MVNKISALGEPYKSCTCVWEEGADCCFDWPGSGSIPIPWHSEL